MEWRNAKWVSSRTLRLRRRCLTTVLWMVLTANCLPIKAEQNEVEVLPVDSVPTHLIVLGASGEDEFASTFRNAGEAWRNAFEGRSPLWIDGTANAASPESEDEDGEQQSDRDHILDFIQKVHDDALRDRSVPCWIVLIGHGTSDASGAKFNLRGPDLQARELADALSKSEQSWVLINAFSSSGPFIDALSGPNRIVVTATKSGSEQNYSRFGEYLAAAIQDPRADLDHDHQISILEAFLAASSETARFYREAGRLATEQALIDDNGDRRGTPAAFFRGLRPVKAPANGLQLDGSFAKSVIVSTLGEGPSLSPDDEKKLHDLEKAIAELKAKKQELESAEFYDALEALLLQIAHLVVNVDETLDSRGH